MSDDQRGVHADTSAAGEELTKTIMAKGKASFTKQEAHQRRQAEQQRQARSLGLTTNNPEQPSDGQALATDFASEDKINADTTTADTDPRGEARSFRDLWDYDSGVRYATVAAIVWLACSLWAATSTQSSRSVQDAPFYSPMSSSLSIPDSNQALSHLSSIVVHHCRQVIQQLKHDRPEESGLIGYLDLISAMSDDELRTSLFNGFSGKFDMSNSVTPAHVAGMTDEGSSDGSKAPHGQSD